MPTKFSCCPKGRVVERGRHDELLAQNGLYRQMWDRQSNGFADGDQDNDAEGDAGLTPLAGSGTVE